MQRSPALLNVIRRSWFAPLLVVLVSFGFYYWTLAPTIVWGDPAKLALSTHELYVRPWSANHALHNLIGWVWGQIPFGDYFFGQNLLSALFSSLGLGVIAAGIYLLTGSRLASVLGALALGVSHTFWWLSVINESYSLLFLFFALCLYGGIRWRQSRQDRWLALSAFSLSLGFVNHTVTPLFVPAFLLLVLLLEPRLFLSPKRLAFQVGAALLGLSPFIYIVVDSLSTYSAADLWQRMFEGSFLDWWTGGWEMLRVLAKYSGYLFYQFIGFGVFLGLVGARRQLAEDTKLFVFLGVLFGSTVLFASGWFGPRQPEIVTPSYIVFSLWIGIGIAALQEGFGNERLTPARFYRFVQGKRLPPILAALLLAVPVSFYYLMPSVAKSTGIKLLNPRTVSYRDNDRYFLLPDRRGYYGARRFGEEVFALVEPGSLIIGDFTPLTVLQYLQTAEGIRPDVRLVDTELISKYRTLDISFVDDEVKKRAVYILDADDYPELYRMDYLRDRYKIVPQGPIFRLEPLAK